MLTPRNIIHLFKARLKGTYTDREIDSLCRMSLNHVLKTDAAKRLLLMDNPLTSSQITIINKILEGLLLGKPIQYLLGTAYFYGIPLSIAEGILIPRPETEELVEWLIHSNSRAGPRIIDIGTGSGCIALAIKQHIPGATVIGTDVSPAAIEMARTNARRLGLEVDLIENDIFIRKNWPGGPFDAVISNPPYIPLSKKPEIDLLVKNNEPETALFVKDDDPLVFYRSIAAFFLEEATPGGSLYLEIHEEYGTALVELLTLMGLSQIELRHDINGKHRMIRGIK